MIFTLFTMLGFFNIARAESAIIAAQERGLIPSEVQCHIRHSGKYQSGIFHVDLLTGNTWVEFPNSTNKQPIELISQDRVSSYGAIREHCSIGSNFSFTNTSSPRISGFEFEFKHCDGGFVSGGSTVDVSFEWNRQKNSGTYSENLDQKNDNQNGKFDHFFLVHDCFSVK